MSTTDLKKPVTIKDVALAAGVTKGTVSKVFNDKAGIAPVTVELVRNVARELNFQPNPHAQRLSAGGCSNTIALCFMLDLGVSARKLQIIQGLLMQEGYEIPAYALRHGTNARIDKQTTDIVDNVCRQRPQAIVITRMPTAAMKKLRRFQEEGGIVVSYDTPTDFECDQVVFDRENSGYLAANHLLALGHRDIGYCSPGSSNPNGEYLDGFRRALTQRGVCVCDDWLFGSDTHGFIGGIYEEAGAQLAEKFLRLKHRPTAMCISDDYAAVAFAASLEAAGLRVPEDVSVTGMDDAPIARYGPLKLTTVTHPVDAIASAVVDLVRSRVEGTCESDNRRVVLKGELMVRGSTKPLK